MVACASHHLSKAKVRTGQAVVRAAGGNRLKTLRALPYYPTAVDRPFCTSQSTLTVVLVQAMVDAATMEKLEAGFSKLQASDSKSLLKKYLTKEVFDALKNKKTSFGSTLLDCIQC
ncbi:unnamed protein product [Leptidea sinapis]|uniref:Phosphagen kinase N-terminal domain-containing protein n=1 Tax=Leptidea sinapis TaxID=189913 RepID=A0A5E4R7E1_9NEOP|nr:unnamed protein product [Leptidea sinapis]